MSDQLQLGLDPAAAIVAHAEAVLRGEAGPWPLPEEHRPLLAALLRHRGASAPIGIAELMSFLPLGEREIKEAVKSLVENFRVPVGASRQKPYGYYLVQSAQDLALAIRPYVHELRSIGSRVRALEAAAPALAGQLNLSTANPEEAA